MHDRMVGRIMAHEHELMMAHRDRGRYTATPPFRHQGSERA
jgi:hypothetical protein